MQRTSCQFVVAQAGPAVLMAIGHPRGNCDAVLLYNLGPGDVLVTALHGCWMQGSEEHSFQALQCLSVPPGQQLQLFDRQEANDFGVNYGGNDFAGALSPRRMRLELATPQGRSELEFILDSQMGRLSQTMQVRGFPVETDVRELPWGGWRAS